ncbi:MAG: hypothetical protein A3K19_23270 [Lentisphaerae bacterium RIFOXYB12_FULL_65_16]|nr:MAG: hypothetical protein A3K18_26090 [Lentisphaerae bacterium RIFOXYA12_64_32]OGV89153.1 MAG: hypothetical protein A3K19_23270 [Lentisphaerae bacterium RIFOXYB12_FULL_65_16]
MPTWIVTPPWSHLSFQILGGKRDRYGAKWAGNSVVSSDFSRLYLLEEGTAVVTTRRGPVELRPGQFYLFPAGQTAHYHCPREMILLWVHFRLEAVPLLDVFTRYDPPSAAAAPTGALDRFELLLNTMGSTRPGAALNSVGILADFLQPFMPERWDAILPQPDKLERLQPALRTIQSEMSQDLNLRQLADQVHLHPTYFSNLFREVFGIAPKRYLTELRIRRAKALLLASDRSIAEVARECGFDDPFYFSRLFRRHVGIAPRAFHRAGGVLGP